MGRRQNRLPVVRMARATPPRHGFDDVVMEEPLDVRIGGGTLAITMRTPGDDFELAAGFCLTEGVLDAGAVIKGMRFCPDVETFNTLDVELSGEPVLHERATIASAACGVCGKTAIEDVRRRLPSVAPGPSFAAALLHAAPSQLRERQATFRRTGGLHAAGLLSPGGEWLCAREDVGRHNAVDKVVGWALLDDRVPLRGTALVVSGRAGFEIIQKALAAGIPLLAAVGAPTTLAVELAADSGMTLIGWLRDGSMSVYTCPERVVP